MSKGKLIKVCGDCANYDWKKHCCKLGCNEGEPQEPFYSDCPLPTVDTDRSVVEEIFAEIQKYMDEDDGLSVYMTRTEFYDLKKKYTEEK